MREIRFRAWDKEFMRMSPVTCLTDEGAFLSELPPEGDQVYGRIVVKSLEKGRFRKFEFIEIMQFTGLRDKAGKMIYEGDICKQKFSTRPEHIGEVKITSTQGVKVGTDCIWPHNVEIIGNIYENEDLLKQQ